MATLEELAAQAVRLATDNAAIGQLPFAAVVARDGQVLATGVNTALHDHDPAAHAEVTAVRAACAVAGEVHVTGAIVVSSCEPCALCHAVAATAGVSRIYYAAPKELVPDLGYPAPPVHAELLATMQRLFREAAPDQIVHIPTEGADAPFRRYLEARQA